MASVTKCDRITVCKVPEKVPDPKEHFLIESNIDLPALTADDALIQLCYVSVDPYLRGQLATFKDNKRIDSFCVGQVVDVGDNVKNIKQGDWVMGLFPWQSYFVINSNACHLVPSKLPKLKSQKEVTNDEKTDDNTADEMMDASKIPKSYFIGQLGMPGMTAYYGLYDKGQLKASDTVLVSGAAGAVGSMVGQLAKLHGCKKIVGTAGSQEKLDFMKSIGFTDVVNYKEYNDSESMQKKLAEIFGKDGIDVYFDNTGGHVTASQWDLLNKHARVIICGQIASYNDGNDVEKVAPFLGKLIYKEIEIKGIIYHSFTRYQEFYSRLCEWVLDKKVVIRETVVKGGLEAIPQAFCDLFVGKNIGKMVVDLGVEK